MPVLFRREIVAVVAGMLGSTPAMAGTLHIEITNVRNAAGLVHADICPETRFLKDDCTYSADIVAQPGVTNVTLHDIPPGRYAVQVFHDENRNHKVDRNFLGVPREGIAFSNDARIVLGPPRFADAAFDLGEGPQTIRMRMRYMSGPSGPPAAR